MGKETAVVAKEKKDSARNWKQNRPVKLKFTYKEQKEYEIIDEEIAALESQLEETMERWGYLNDLAEKIAKQSV